MPKQYQPVEINQFVRGLITEVSPLTYPDGASLDERNFVLNRDGTRRRRLGIEEEAGTPVSVSSDFSNKTSFSTSFIWNNPGGNPDKNFLVLQDGQDVMIFDRNVDIISGRLLHIFKPTSYIINQEYSFSSVDGVLVVATGGKAIYKVEYNGGVSFKDSYFTLKIRDVFGLDDGLFEGMSVTERPKDEFKHHIYNLRNQTWAVPRRNGNSESNADPIVALKNAAGLFPSNADTVNQALFADPNDGDNRTVRRFFASEVIDNPLGTVEAPRGYFIIDALDRGNSRKTEIQLLQAQYPNLSYKVDTLPEDRTETGATAIAEYAGRMWYAGFGSESIGADSRSPRLSSYVLFSQLVRDPTNFPACYQKADPTNPDDSDLVDTDGGFIRIEEASNIRKLVNVGRRLVVMAENGVWSIEGGSDYGFTATNYMVRKVTDKGLLSASSVVVVDQTLLYWAESGIIVLAPSELGDFTAQNITNTSIQKLYNDITYNDKVRASGSYDSYELTVHWVYGGNKELIFDTNLQAFYVHEYDASKEVRSIFNVAAFREGVQVEPITVDGVPVTVDGSPVVITTSVREPSIKEVKYATVTNANGSSKLSFATLNNAKFKDWGVNDAQAYMITGQLTANDFQRNKNVPYLTLHFMRTESGFDEDFNPTDPSGCKVRAAWDWANSPNSNRWGREFQGYRYKRVYMPADSTDTFDTGFETIVTKNKLRGKGKALSLHFRTEPEKDCHLLGWSMVLGINNNV